MVESERTKPKHAAAADRERQLKSSQSTLVKDEVVS